jgi:hypothetical protein
MAKPRSIRVRYTLRALFVFITLFMLWGGYHTNRSWKERAAEEILQKRGASIQYAAHSFQGTFADRVGAAYAMLVEIVWQDRSVSRVMVFAPLDPEVTHALCALSQLRELSIAPSHRTPAQYALLRSGQPLQPSETIPQGALQRILDVCPLVELNIGNWVLSDRDCQAIASCPSIKYLGVDGSEFSEQGLAVLISKRGLISFTFGWCDATGSALGGQPGSPTLERVVCNTAPVDVELAAFVARSPNVKELAVGNCSAPDDFVLALGAHPSLRDLSLGRAKVTDDSIAVTDSMPALRTLFLPESVSAQEVARLKKRRPQLQVLSHP